MLIFKFVKSQLMKKKILDLNGEIKNYAVNTGWIFLDKLIKLSFGFFVYIYLTRYLGPYNLGVLAYSQTIIAIFVAISTLGLTNGGILLKNLVEGKNKSTTLLGTITFLTMITSLVSIITLSIWIYFTDHEPTHTIIHILSISIIFQNLNMIFIDYFQSIVLSKYSALAGILSMLVSSAIKVSLIYFEASLSTFAVAIIFDSFFSTTILFIFYLKYRKNICIWDFNFTILKQFLRSAIPLTLAALSALLYTRIDQLMIKSMLGIESLGNYSIAIYLTEIFYVIPTIISFSLFTKMVELRTRSNGNYFKFLLRIYSLLVWIALPLTILLFLLSNKIIMILYGGIYPQAGGALKILSLCLIFNSINLISIKILYVEGFEKKYVYRTIFGIIINILLNYLLIPIYGINGAAIATVITLFSICYLYDLTDKELMKFYSLKIKCFNPRRILFI